MIEFEKPKVIFTGQIPQKRIDDFCQEKNVNKIVDVHDSQILELFEVLNPGTNSSANTIREFRKVSSLAKPHGVFFPWDGTLLICLGNEASALLRTNRNQYLIGAKEQEKLQNFRVGVAGLSVGASIATAIAYSGISKSMKISDKDVLSATNLNRLNEKIANIGKPKAHLAAQKIFEVDPFAEIEIFDKGLDSSNVKSFIKGLNLVFEEIDDFKMKFALRVEARTNKVPLIMITNIGDGILIDVERYDTQPDTRLFNGALGNNPEKEFDYNNLTPELMKKLSVKLVGQEYVPNRALESLVDIGKKLVGRPQLFGSVTISAGTASFVARKIALGEKVMSGRYFFKLTDLFELNDTDYKMTSNRTALLDKIISNA